MPQLVTPQATMEAAADRTGGQASGGDSGRLVGPAPPRGAGCMPGPRRQPCGLCRPGWHQVRRVGAGSGQSGP
jgi:hypothetical protein